MIKTIDVMIAATSNQSEMTHSNLTERLSKVRHDLSEINFTI